MKGKLLLLVLGSILLISSCESTFEKRLSPEERCELYIDHIEKCTTEQPTKGLEGFTQMLKCLEKMNEELALEELTPKEKEIFDSCISKKQMGQTQQAQQAFEEIIKKAQQAGCTKEAKVCSDGTSVGRNPVNNCEFYPCPQIINEKGGREIKLGGKEYFYCTTPLGEKDPTFCTINHEDYAKYGEISPQLIFEFDTNLIENFNREQFEKSFKSAYFGIFFPDKSPKTRQNGELIEGSAYGSDREITNVVFESFEKNILKGKVYAQLNTIELFDEGAEGCGIMDSTPPDHCFSSEKANLKYTVYFAFTLEYFD